MNLIILLLHSICILLNGDLGCKTIELISNLDGNLENDVSEFSHPSECIILYPTF